MNAQMLPTIEIASAYGLSKVDTESTIGTVPIKCPVYEKRRWLYILTLPLMWALTIHVVIKKEYKHPVFVS